jgi:hypothetical protein
MNEISTLVKYVVRDQAHKVLCSTPIRAPERRCILAHFHSFGLLISKGNYSIADSTELGSAEAVSDGIPRVQKLVFTCCDQTFQSTHQHGILLTANAARQIDLASLCRPPPLTSSSYVWYVPNSPHRPPVPARLYPILNDTLKGCDGSP